MRRQINTLRALRALCLPATLAALLLTGCVKRELDYRDGPDPGPGEGLMDISLHWEQEQHPASVRYLIYNEAGNLVKEVSGITDSYRDVFPAGKYRLAVHNTDASNVDYRGTDRHESAEVFALENPVKRTKGDNITDDTPLILEPQAVYGTGNCREFEVIEVVANETRTATVAPTLLTRQVRLLFKMTDNTPLRSLTGSLQGVSQGVFLATGKCNISQSCAVSFDGRRVDKGSEYMVELTVFNLLTQQDSPDNTSDIQISIVEESGKPHDATFDLTDVIRDIIKENGGVIPIEIPIEITLRITEFGLTSSIGRWEPGANSGGDVD